MKQVSKSHVCFGEKSAFLVILKVNRKYTSCSVGDTIETQLFLHF